MTEPRIPPLPVDERDDRTRQTLEEMGLTESGMNLFDTLARHPRLLRHWGAFGGALLYRGTLPETDREILILRTAANCGADYEWGHHLVIGERIGLDRDRMLALAEPDPSGLDAVDRILVAAADELHVDQRITDTTWADLAERYDEQQLIELCMLVGQYHLVAFTLNSLGIRPEDGVEPLPGGSNGRTTG